MIALVIRADATVERCAVEPEPETIKAIVGGWLEGVMLEGWHMYVDEDGLRKQLPPNVIATMLARHYGFRDVIVGTAVAFGTVGTGEADVPEQVIEQARILAGDG